MTHGVAAPIAFEIFQKSVATCTRIVYATPPYTSRSLKESVFLADYPKIQAIWLEFAKKMPIRNGAIASPAEDIHLTMKTRFQILSHALSQKTARPILRVIILIASFGLFDAV